MSELSQRVIKFVRGVGARRAEILMNDVGVVSYEDMLQYFPYKYVDKSHVYAIRELQNGMPYVQIRGRFMSMRTVDGRLGGRLVAEFTDGTGTVEVVWFKGLNYVKEQIAANEEYLLFGKPTAYGGRLNIVHPDMEKCSEHNPNAGTLQPFYNTSARMKQIGLNSKAIGKIVQTIFAEIGPTGVAETLPAWLITKCSLMVRGEALRTVHFPPNTPSLERARFRLKFEELFYIQMKLLRSRNLSRSKIAGIVFAHSGQLLNDFYKNHMPFEPTDAQKRVVREIRSDFGSGYQMNRLLQGDVGSGKTLVALMSMLIAVGNGYQACMMAPTEILATQHFESLCSMLKDMPVKVALLTGSTKRAKRNEILAGLADGSINIIVGTHALIEETVVFANLGFAVVDEQHRFGVAQRARLWKKSERPPHILVMTATPIPRTLAMTVYGDLDVSVIDQLPPGRKPVRTEHYFHTSRNSLNKFIRSELQKGRQAYIVYPLIEESEAMDFKNLTDGFEYVKQSFPEYTVCMVHGRMKADEKESAMNMFVNGQSQILVATTVIEVGVNVPNASIMVIESAERFGLSQLHQLRGRVGRGADQSYCILLTSHKLSNETRKRMSIMVDTCDGFAIAEADMQLRGPGDLDGTQQSGLPFALRIANIAKDAKLVQYSREMAQMVLADDPLLQKPENRIFVTRLYDLDANNKANWSMIS